MNKTQEALKMAIESMKELQGSVITYEINCNGNKCRELYCSDCYFEDTVEKAINDNKAKVEKTDKVIQACKEALAELEQVEPFGYFKAEPFGWTDCADTDEGAIALYKNPPPKREWRGLSDEEIIEIWESKRWGHECKFSRAIEAKLKELNHD